ncbi:MAG: hypothetical protein R3F61_24910 [Myxococcota bacterium]
MLWIVLSALAAPGLEETPAHLVGLPTWEQRIAHLEEGLAEAPDADKPAWERALRLVRVLAKRHPDTARAEIRALVRSAIGTDEIMAGEAQKAAFLGRPLPVRQADSDWFAALPAPVRADPPVRFAVTADAGFGEVGEVAKSLEDLAVGVGWKIDAEAPEVRVDVSPSQASMWGGLGQSAEATVTLPGGGTFVVEGFAPGPSCPDSRAVLLATLWGNLLAQPLAPDSGPPTSKGGLLPKVESGRVCVARPPSSAPTPLQLDIGEGFALDLLSGQLTCLDLPAGMVLGAEEGRHTVVGGTEAWLTLDHGLQATWARVDVADPKKIEKSKAKGRLAEVATEPVAVH